MSGVTYVTLANIEGMAVDLERRRLFLNGALDQEKAVKILDALYALESDGNDPVYVRLYSCGGTVISGLAVYDALTTAPFRVLVTVYGEALSMAVPLLQAGDHRAMMPNARLLLHAISYDSREEEMTREKLRAQDRELETMADQYEAIVAKRSGASLRTVQRWCQAETYFSAQKALKAGLIDEVVQCRK